jgi:diguanylate cyclase (GGDEF)-like protein
MLHLNAFPRQAIFWNEILIILMMGALLVYYHFARSYTNKSAGIGLYVGYIFLAALAVLSFNGYVVKSTSVVNGILYQDTGNSLYIIGAAGLTFVSAVIFLLVKRYRSSTDPIDRNRTMYLMSGWGILVFFGYTNLIPAAAGLPLDHIGSLFNALIISYAIFRFQLLNIRFVARTGLTYFILIVCLVGIYAGAILLGHRFFPDQPLYSILFLASGLALLLALLARPLRYAIQEGIDRLFYRGTYEYRQTLLRFNSRMGNILNLNELADEMLPAITKALNITQAKLLFPNTTNDDFTTQFIYPKVASELSDELRFNADNPIVAWLDKKDDPLNPEQIDTIPEFKGLWKTEREQLTTSNVGLFFPIKSRGKLIGILALGNKWRGTPYSHEDIELVYSMASQAGIVIENARLYTQATVRANTDGLTVLYNHRHFHERLEQEIARGSRFGSRFSLIMLDIDLFKAYNDIYGHLAGDKILRSIGSIIKSSIRNLDMAFRYGGEEFAIILPEAWFDDAYKAAERIRQTIEAKLSGKAMPMTVSLGVASWPADGVMAEEIISCADMALYRAKQTGRNRTCLSSEVAKSEVPLEELKTQAHQGTLSIVYALAATVDAKDSYTYGHSKKVGEYAVALSQMLDLPQDRIAIIRDAALLHDIKEWEPVKAHPELGVEILRHVIDLVNCLPAILHHHERYDGSGYPSGLKGDNIPIEARILAIADAYDAITSLRPYHKQLSPQQAFAELKRHAGTQFDPELVDIFCKAMEPAVLKELEIG